MATKQRVLELNDAGLSVREIAGAVGVSTQRVYQIFADQDITPPSKRDTEQENT